MRISSLILMGIIAFVMGYYAHQSAGVARAAVTDPGPTIPLDHNPVGFTAKMPPPGANSETVVSIRGGTHGCVSGRPCTLAFHYLANDATACESGDSVQYCTVPECTSKDECILFSEPIEVSHIDYAEQGHSSETMAVKGILVMRAGR